MQNLKVKRLIEKAKKPKKYDPMEVASLNTYINVLREHVVKNYPDLEPDEIRLRVMNEFATFLVKHIHGSNLKGLYYQTIALRELQKDPEFIKSEYERIKNEPIELEDVYFTENLGKNKRVLIKQIFDSMRIEDLNVGGKQLEFFRKIKTDSKARRTYLETHSIPEAVLQKRLDFLFDKYPDKLINHLYLYVSPIEKELKSNLIDNLVFYGKFFEMFDLLEKYNTRHSRKMSELGCSELKFELTTGEFDVDKIGLKELFSKEFLETVDVDTLTVLNICYQNRFSKEIDHLGEAVFAIGTLNAWEDLKKDKKIEYSTDLLTALKHKAKCIDNVSLDFFYQKGVKYELKTQEDKDRGFAIVQKQDNYLKISKQEGEMYKKIFDEILPESENDILKDLETYRIPLNARENIYYLKESCFSTLIYSLLKDKSAKNFGVIEEEIIGEKRVKVNSNSSYVLIGIDYEGLNMPLRLHIKRDSLIDVLQSYTGSTIMPLYEGARDFELGNQVIPTNVLMPIPKRHKKVINDLYKTSKGQNKERFVSHLRFLKDPGTGKFPKHLMRQEQTSKGVKFVRKPRKYVDIKTGNYFIKGKNEELILRGDEVEFE